MLGDIGTGQGNDDMPGRKALTIACAGFVLAGCAPFDEVRLEDRTYARADYENRFLDYRAACQRNGGRVYILASGRVGRDGVPTRGDRYFCR